MLVNFTMHIDVKEPYDLMLAASRHPDAVGCDPGYFINDDGTIDIKACLIMLLDPGSLAGCDIIDSTLESV